MCRSSHYRFGTHPALWIEDLVNVCVSIRLPCDRIGLFFSGGFPIPFSTCALKTGKVGPGLCKNGCGKKVAQGLPERKQRLGTTDAINQLEKVLQKMTPKNSKSTIRGSGRLISWKPMALWRFNCFNFRGVTWIFGWILWGKLHSQKSFGCLIYIGDYITWLKRRDHYNAKLCCIIMYVYFDDGNPGTRDGIVFCGKKCSRLLYGISWSRSYMASGLQVLPTCHVFENIEQNIPNLTGPHDPSTALKGGKPI